MKKVVLVTGSTGDLGSSIAHTFAKDGYDVILHYHTNNQKAQEFSAFLEKQYNTKTLLVQADISKEDEVKEMFNKITNEFSGIDVLINCAAISNDSLFLDKKREDFLKVYDVNLIGSFLTSKYASPIMQRRKKGVIINISSTNSLNTNYPYSADYDCSKAALNMLGRNLAKTLKPYIRVLTICPGWINTSITKELTEDFKSEEEKKILLGRFAEVEEIAQVVLFLASDSASYINNTIIRVDGGYDG